MAAPVIIEATAKQTATVSALLEFQLQNLNIHIIFFIQLIFMHGLGDTG